MAELTTLRIEKQTVDLLNSLKGYLEYHSGERLTFNEALSSILITVDSLYRERQSLLDVSDKVGLQEGLRKRIDQFWGKDNKEKPDIIAIDPRYIIVKEKEMARGKQRPL